MRILHDDGTGGLAIVIPAPQYLASLQAANPQATEAQLMEYIANKDVPNGTAFEVVEDADIPTDRTFRNAWKHDTSPAPEKVSADMTKAAVIAHEIRRAKRDEAFKPHDMVVAVQVPGQGAAQTAAEAARATIRTADAAHQVAIDAATTEAELKAAIDAIAH